MFLQNKQLIRLEGILYSKIFFRPLINCVIRDEFPEI
jgi:hypothetical protein